MRVREITCGISTAVDSLTIHTHTCNVNLKQDFKHSNCTSKHRLMEESAAGKTKTRTQGTEKNKSCCVSENEVKFKHQSEAG